MDDDPIPHNILEWLATASNMDETSDTRWQTIKMLTDHIMTCFGTDNGKLPSICVRWYEIATDTDKPDHITMAANLLLEYAFELLLIQFDSQLIATIEQIALRTDEIENRRATARKFIGIYLDLDDEAYTPSTTPAAHTQQYLRQIRDGLITSPPPGAIIPPLAMPPVPAYHRDDLLPQLDITNEDDNAVYQTWWHHAYNHLHLVKYGRGIPDTIQATHIIGLAREMVRNEGISETDYGFFYKATDIDHFMQISMTAELLLLGLLWIND